MSCGRSVSTQQFFDYWLSHAPHSFKEQLQIMTMPHRPDDRVGYIIDNQLLYKDFGCIPSDNLSQILASCWSLFDQSLRL